MDNYKISQVYPSDFATFGLDPLLQIPEPPQKLWYRGKLPNPDLHLLAVVGSREYTSYGKQVVDYLISGLKNYPVGIISGLALGIDGLAHEAALKNNLYTLSVPGSGLDEAVLYPATHRKLALKILESGGGLMSELAPEETAKTWTFPQRNRIMAGLCSAVLLIEAGAKSGTLITARMTVDYNRELLAVPGSIFSKNSYGTHQFLKLGATLVTEPEDILEALRLEVLKPAEKVLPTDLKPEEEIIIKQLLEPKDRDSLIRTLGLPASDANRLLMQMEMSGYIKYDAPYYRSLL